MKVWLLITGVVKGRLIEEALTPQVDDASGENILISSSRLFKVLETPRNSRIEVQRSSFWIFVSSRFYY